MGNWKTAEKEKKRVPVDIVQGVGAGSNSDAGQAVAGDKLELVE